MTEQVNAIKDKVHEEHGYTSCVANALNIFDAAITILDGLLAEYSVNYSEGVIIITVDPKLSYDGRRFAIDIQECRMTTENL